MASMELACRPVAAQLVEAVAAAVSLRWTCALDLDSVLLVSSALSALAGRKLCCFLMFGRFFAC